MDVMIEAMKAFMPPEKVAQLEAATKLYELFKEIVPESKQAAITEAIKAAIPKYEVKKNAKLGNKVYAVAILIEKDEANKK